MKRRSVAQAIILSVLLAVFAYSCQRVATSAPLSAGAIFADLEARLERIHARTR